MIQSSDHFWKFLCVGKYTFKLIEKCHRSINNTGIQLYEKSSVTKLLGEFFIIEIKAGRAPAFVLTKTLKLDENHKAKPCFRFEREPAEGEGLTAKWQSHCRRQP